MSAGDTLNKALGQALEEARQRTQGRRGRPLSQDGMSKKLDVHASTVGDWERGTGGLPEYHFIAAWAELAGLSGGWEILERAAQIIREWNEGNAAPPSD